MCPIAEDLNSKFFSFTRKVMLKTEQKIKKKKKLNSSEIRNRILLNTCLGKQNKKKIIFSVTYSKFRHLMFNLNLHGKYHKIMKKKNIKLSIHG